MGWSSKKANDADADADADADDDDDNDDDERVTSEDSSHAPKMVRIRGFMAAPKL